jgi:catechol 2,3-dioxygenase
MQDTLFNPRRLGHVNLIVDRLDPSISFYNKVCGLNLEFIEDGIRGAFLGTGHTNHDVGMIERTREDRYGKDGHLQIPKAAAAVVTLNHLAWEVETERQLVDAYHRAKRAGVTIGRLADHQISHSIYLKDPDGNVIEFYADTIPKWREVLHGHVDLITSVWDPEARDPSDEPLGDPDPELRHVEEAVFHPTRLSHTVLTTGDLPRLAEFYRRVAGLSTVHEGAGVVLLRGTDQVSSYHLAIVAGQVPGLHHLALQVADENSLERAAQAATTRGQRVERRQRGPLKSSVFLLDPDGFRVEFFVPIKDDYAALEAVDQEEKAFLV